jgi:hypothetical protein
MYYKYVIFISEYVDARIKERQNIAVLMEVFLFLLQCLENKRQKRIQIKFTVVDTEEVLSRQCPVSSWVLFPSREKNFPSAVGHGKFPLQTNT